ncbi:Thioredoxin domain protein [Rhodopirellula maiorica SM1]|uniref:Thioredoxin domain protein n=1 Tax=Rhodopirellula maiorica SM1 TaxID=1265738 RepID=M5RSI6_9BACT|nr:thioredoxin domain-containing protein [Rhodopirellula maiorica]EMI22288.1 Thioredoxin domain protein [Rhodopirellula maiorica SM1]
MPFHKTQHVATALIALILLAVGCDRDLSQTDEIPSPTDAGPIQLTDDSFQAEVLESELPVLVDMWAPWCKPCIAMKPAIQRLALELSGDVKVAELNIEENPFIQKKYDIDKYPILLIFVDGIETQRLVGSKTHEQLLNALTNHVAVEKLR